MLKRYINIVKNGVAMLLKKGALHIMIGSFITKFVGMFSSAFYSRMFEKSDYGILGYVENLFNYAFLFASLGLTYSIYRYVVKADSTEKKLSYYSYVIKRGFFYDILITVAVALFFAFIYHHSADFTRAKYLTAIILLALPFQSLFNTNLACFRSMYDNKRYAAYSCVSSIVFILLKLLFAYLFSLDGVFFARCIVYLAFSIVMMLVLKKRYFGGMKVFSAEPLSRAEKKEVNVYSVQYMVTNGIWALFALNEVFLLGIVCGDSTEIANYKVAFILPACLSLLSNAIFIFVSPYIVKHEKDHKWLRSTLVKTVAATSALVVPAAAVMCIFGRPLLYIYNPAYENVAPLMCVLVLSSSINLVLRQNIANFFAFTGKVTVNLIVSFAGVIMQILTILFITGKYNSFGVAWTTVGVYSAMTVALAILFVFFFGKKTDKPAKNSSADASVEN